VTTMQKLRQQRFKMTIWYYFYWRQKNKVKKEKRSTPNICPSDHKQTDAIVTQKNYMRNNSLSIGAYKVHGFRNKKKSYCTKVTAAGTPYN